MAKKQTQSLDIKNFSTISPKAISVILIEYEGEEDTYNYNPGIVLHLNISEENGEIISNQAITIVTDINSNSLEKAIKAALTCAVSLFDCPILSIVDIFDEFGEIVNSFDLNNLQTQSVPFEFNQSFIKH